MSSVVKDMAGKTGVIVTTCEDITERKQMEKALSEERNLLRILIDNLPDYIFIEDFDGRFLMNNMAHVRFLGASTPEELIGKTIFDFFSKEFATRDDADNQNILQTGRPLIDYEHIIINREGNKRLHSTTKMPLRNSQGDIVGLMTIDRDITKPYQTEEGLRLLERALETMQLGLTIAALDGKIIYTNRAEAEMHGYQIEELLGKDIGIFAPPELRKPLTLEQIKEWKGLIRESVNIRKDGTTFPVWLMSEIVKNTKGNPCAIVTTCEDITKRKAIEEE
jgi:PAS domain S-box-containing protein